MNLLSKIPSISEVWAKAIASARRLPAVLLCAVVGTIAAIVLIEDPGDDVMATFIRLLLSSALGLPLFIALTTTAERFQWKRSWLTFATVAGFVVLGLYYWSLPDLVEFPQQSIARFFLLAIGLHLLVSFFPFVTRSDSDSFWEYNKALFLRILISALFSAVLFLGLTIALAALDNLFGMDIDEQWYFELWVICAGIINTWLFIGGIPKFDAEPKAKFEYPTALKIFSAYILLPLVLLYFAILISYEAKIVITWNWPRGWVSLLILWYSVFGILSMLLLHPLRNFAENKWIPVFYRWFFRALIPLVIMLALAIWRRVSEYGITENRYFVIVMALGLVIVTAYFIISRVKDIRAIPIVLCVLALLSTYGPQSAFSVSKASQLQRLESMLAKYDLPPESQDQFKDIAPDDLQNMSSIVRYLNEWHTPEVFASLVDDSVITHALDTTWYQANEIIAHGLGFEYGQGARRPGEPEYFSLRLDNHHFIPTKDFNNYVTFTADYNMDMERMYYLADDTITVNWESRRAKMDIRQNTTGDSVTLDLAVFIRKQIDHKREQMLPWQKMIIDGNLGEYRVRCLIEIIDGLAKQPLDSVEINNLRCTILLQQPDEN